MAASHKTSPDPASRPRQPGYQAVLADRNSDLFPMTGYGRHFDSSAMQTVSRPPVLRTLCNGCPDKGSPVSRFAWIMARILHYLSS